MNWINFDETTWRLIEMIIIIAIACIWPVMAYKLDMKEMKKFTKDTSESGKCRFCGRSLRKLRLYTVELWEQDYPSGEHRKRIEIKGKWFWCPHCDAFLTDAEEIAKAMLSKGE